MEKALLHHFSPMTDHTVLHITDFHHAPNVVSHCYRKNPLEPCVIYRGCYNSTHCLRTLHYSPIFSYGILNPPPSILSPPPVLTHSDNPNSIIFRPQVRSTTLYFSPNDFHVQSLLPACTMPLVGNRMPLPFLNVSTPTLAAYYN